MANKFRFNGKLFLVVVAVVVAGCSAISSLGKPQVVVAKSRKHIPSSEKTLKPSPAAVTYTPRNCIMFGGREEGQPVGSNYVCPPGMTPPPDPPLTIDGVRVCPSNGVRYALGELKPLPEGIGQKLTMVDFSCGTFEENTDDTPLVAANKNDKLTLFTGREEGVYDSNGWSTDMILSTFLAESFEATSVVFVQPENAYSSRERKYASGFGFHYSFPVATLPGDVERRDGTKLTLTGQGARRYGDQHAEWPCSQTENSEYGNNKYVDVDFNRRFFAIGSRYVVRSLEVFSGARDGNGVDWITLQKILQAVRRPDGKTFKLIRKYMWLYNDAKNFRHRESSDAGISSFIGIDSFVWSQELKAFVRNPFTYGMFGKIRGFEVFTEDDLDTLLAANEGSPCGLD